jgi:hypothetical protein
METSVQFEWLVAESISHSLVDQLREAEIEVDLASIKPVGTDRLLDTDTHLSPQLGEHDSPT